MKKLIVVILAQACFSLAWAQVSEKSAVVAFNFNTPKTSLSRTSNALKFGSLNQAAISSVSQVLSFGSPNNVASENNSAVATTTSAQNNSVQQVKKEPEVATTYVQAPEPTPIKAPEVTTAIVIPGVNNAITQNQPQTEPQRAVVEETKKAAPQLGSEYTRTIPRFVALVIGVSKYKYAEGGGPRNLANAANDAEKLYNTLITKYNFDTTNSKLLRDANRQQILDELDRLTAETTEKDNVLIFYAGHGYYDSHTEFGYWLPADSKTTTRSDWIANSTIKDYMSAVKSKHTLLIADACFGGSIFKSRSVDAVTFLKMHELYKDPSKRAITSGNLSEVPDKSVFLDQLLKKLNENEDDYLPSQKLFSRIYEPVSNNATEPQFGVIQGAGDEGGDFIFIKKN